MEVGLLTEIMNAFVEAFSGGFDRIRPAISGLLHILIGIDVAWFAVQVTLGVECLSSGLRKMMSIGLWTFIALQFDQHAFALIDSLVQAGMMVGNSGGQSARSVLNPSAILDAGFSAAEPIAKQVLKSSLLSFVGTFPMFVLTWLMMMLAYGALAISAFMVMIEFYLAIAVVGILLPFGVLPQTRWIAMKPMSYFLSCGLKMMLIAFLVAISKTVLTKIHFSSDEPTLREMWIAVCCTGMISLLCWKAPDRLANGFMSGGSSFGGSDVVRQAQSVTAAAVRTVGALGSVGGAAIATVAGAAVAGSAVKSKGQSLYTGFKMLQGLAGPGSPGRGGSSASSSGTASAGLAASASARASATPPPMLNPPSDSTKNAAE